MRRQPEQAVRIRIRGEAALTLDVASDYLPRWRAFDPEKKRFVPVPELVWIPYADPRLA